MKKKIKQTAVEWLKAELESYGSPSQLDIKWDVFDQLIKQAIAMEKEQKKFMFDCGRQYQLTGEGTFTQVYNETYGK